MLKRLFKQLAAFLRILGDIGWSHAKSACVRVGVLVRRERHVQNNHQLVQDIINSIRVPQMPTRDWVLPLSDPRIQAWIGSLVRNNNGRSQWWETDYQIIVQSQGYESLDHVRKEAVAKTPFKDADTISLEKLQPREEIILMVTFLNLVAKVGAAPTPPFLHMWDLYQSLNRVPHSDGISPAVLPSSML